MRDSRHFLRVKLISVEICRRASLELVNHPMPAKTSFDVRARVEYGHQGNVDCVGCSHTETQRARRKRTAERGLSQRREGAKEYGTTFAAANFTIVFFASLRLCERSFPLSPVGTKLSRILYVSVFSHHLSHDSQLSPASFLTASTPCLVLFVRAAMCKN